MKLFCKKHIIIGPCILMLLTFLGAREIMSHPVNKNFDLINIYHNLFFICFKVCLFEPPPDILGKEWSLQL